MKKIMAIMASTFMCSAGEIYISIENQKIFAIENNQIVYKGSISSGKKGFETPFGEFEITQKAEEHNSTLYPPPNGGASMPYMMRLSGSAVAIHEGYVPKYPASHGCIRVKNSLVKKIFKWSKLGTLVHIVKFYEPKEGVEKRYEFDEFEDDNEYIYDELVVEVY